jgi:hypothetical protein
LAGGVGGAPDSNECWPRGMGMGGVFSAPEDCLRGGDLRLAARLRRAAPL